MIFSGYNGCQPAKDGQDDIQGNIVPGFDVDFFLCSRMVQVAVTVLPNQICAWNWSAQFSTQLWTRLIGKDAVKYTTSCILNVIKFFINVDFGKNFFKKNISDIACFDIEVNSSKSKSWKKANKLKVNTDSKSYGLMLISTIRHRVPHPGRKHSLKNMNQIPT